LSFFAGATSRGKGKSPIPDKPMPRSEGGQFEPLVDSYTGRLMDTDAEYKVLSAIADNLDRLDEDPAKINGNLNLYSELQPCQSCESVVEQFKEKFPQIDVEIYYDLTFPDKQPINRS
jgi:hypothetical protein